MLNKIVTYIKQRHRLPLVGFLCLLVLYSSAQTILSSQRNFDIDQVPQTPQSQPKSKPSTKKPKLIEIISANEAFHRAGFDPQILKDSVILFHDGAYLYCDSAYQDEIKNSFEAFGKVRMEQGDTIFLYGNYMHYDGNTKLVRFRENVRLEHDPQGVTLFTDSLDYDRNLNMGYYFKGGMLVDTLNELTSYWGQYEPDLNKAIFRGKVKLINPKFTLTSDELTYNTQSKKAFLTMPTVIESDSGTIYSYNGWYNTATEEALLLNQSKLVNKEGNRTLTGDSISRRKAEGIAEVFGNMFLQDTIKKVILRGHYGLYNEFEDNALASDSAFCIEYSQGDSLFIHADTLRIITLPPDSLTEKSPKIQKEKAPQANILGADSATIKNVENGDTLAIDSIAPKLEIAKTIATTALSDSLQTKKKEVYRQIKAYHNVRFFRSDMQGVCDSMQFNTKDSILYMYRDPIIWNDKNQLTGDTIEVFMNDSTIDFVHVKRYCFSIEQKDSVLFNQLKGNTMKVYFENKKARRVLVEGNAESVFYPQENDGTITGLNYLTSSYIDIYILNGKLEKLKAWPKPVGKMTPLELVEPSQRRLKDFYWYDYIRPLDKNDIFRKATKKSTDIKPKRASIFDREE